jgi:hypothetical protein
LKKTKQNIYPYPVGSIDCCGIGCCNGISCWIRDGNLKNILLEKKSNKIRFLFTLLVNRWFVVVVRNRFELELDFDLEIESEMVVVVVVVMID